MSGSIYNLLANPAAANPDFYTKGMQNLNLLRDTQAKQAIAGIYQQSTDPVTGQVDPAKFNLLVSRNPQAAWAAGPAMQQQWQAAGAQGQGTLEQVAAHRARMDTMLGLMNGVLAKGGPIGIGDIQTALNQAHLSPTEAAQVSQDANATAGGDPNYDFTNWVKNHQASNLTVQQQIAARTPNMQFHNIGGRLVPVDMNGQTNPNPGSLITTLTPGEATQIVEVTMDDGKTKQQMPLSDAITRLSTNPAMKILGPVAGGPDPIAGLPKDQALAAIVQRESGGKNIPTAILGPDGKPASTASGFYQMLDSTWQEAAPLAGIKNPPPRAMDASKVDQDAAASALYDKYGVQPWQRSARTAPAPYKVAGPAVAPPASPVVPGGNFGMAQNNLTGGAGARFAGPGVPAAPAPAVSTSTTLRGPGSPDVAAAPPAPAPAAPVAPVAPPVAAPAAPAPPAPPIGRSVLGAGAGLEGTREASAKRSNDLVDQYTKSTNIKPILAGMEQELRLSGGTGIGTDTLTNLRQAAVRLGIVPEDSAIASKQSALEQFKKLSSQLQMQQLGSVGGIPTDDRQSLIQASNPSTVNSTAGNRSILHVLQGNQQAIDTMAQAWMNSPEHVTNPAGFDAWRNKFIGSDPQSGGRFDPRTFWVNNMPPDEQHAYLRNMSDKARAEFSKNWAYARKQGWVEPLPGG